MTIDQGRQLTSGSSRAFKTLLEQNSADKYFYA